MVHPFVFAGFDPENRLPRERIKAVPIKGESLNTARGTGTTLSPQEGSAGPGIPWKPPQTSPVLCNLKLHECPGSQTLCTPCPQLPQTRVHSQVFNLGPLVKLLLPAMNAPNPFSRAFMAPEENTDLSLASECRTKRREIRIFSLALGRADRAVSSQPLRVFQLPPSSDFTLCHPALMCANGIPNRQQKN